MTGHDQPTQSANGRPHLTYFDEGVSFVWSGVPTEPIEVCPGGYGEPVQHRLVVLDERLLRPTGTVELVQAFADVCESWLMSEDVDADGVTWV